MIATTPKITRADHGRRMTLAEFEHVEIAEGIFVELAKGVIEVSDIPGLTHSDVQELLRDLFVLYRARGGSIRKIATDTGSKLIIDEDKSERHPDLYIYLTDPPPGQQPWGKWIPEIVVEIVSETSRRRDYIDKPIEYWHAGVKEYWIVDPQNQQVQRFSRGDIEWSIEVLRGDHALTTPLLPEFSLAPNQVFATTPK